jgi:tetratricopeptide (TPR) repeat protein
MSASELLSLGEKYLLEMNYEQAVIYFEQLINLEPRNPSGYTGLATAYVGLEKADKAIDTLETGVKKIPNDTLFLTDVVGIYEDVLGLDPNNPDAYIGLAQVYIALGQEEKAIFVLLQGADATERNSDILALLESLSSSESPSPNSTISPSDLPSGSSSFPPEAPVQDIKVTEQILAGQQLVEFGDYQWSVLSVEGDKALLITEKIVDVQAYNDEYIAITWEECTLRKYLNTEFYDTFSASDKNQILTTHVMNNDNSEYGTPGGNDTDDKIFLLSMVEANKYFISDQNRQAPHTTQSMEKLLSYWYSIGYDQDESYFQGERAWYWWLRSPGSLNIHATRVSDGGGIEADGDGVSNNQAGIRPALYISLSN